MQRPTGPPQSRVTTRGSMRFALTRRQGCCQNHRLRNLLVPFSTLEYPSGTLGYPHGTLEYPHGTLEYPFGTLLGKGKGERGEGRARVGQPKNRGEASPFWKGFDLPVLL